MEPEPSCRGRASSLRDATRWAKAPAAALLCALLLHGLALLGLSLLDAPAKEAARAPLPIALTLRRAPLPLRQPPPAPPPAPKESPSRRPSRKPPPARPAPGPPPSGDEDRVFLPPPRPAPPALRPPRLPEPPAAGPPSSRMIDRVMGQGLPDVPPGLAPDLEALEGALAFRAPGPESDAERARRTAQGFVEDTIAAHDVRRGMANDFFRRYARVLERQWRPRPEDLSDGGRAVSQLGLLEDFLTNPLRFGAYGPKYLEEAIGAWAGTLGLDHTLRHVRDPSAPTTSELRDRPARELRQAFLAALGTRKEALSFTAAAEVRVEHDARGRVMAIEIVTSSGHQRLDEGMREAVARAAEAFGEEAPPGLSGRPFVSTWRMEARWQMTPLRCFGAQSGSGRGPPMAEGTVRTLQCAQKFDIGPDGLEVERPFEVKRHAEVELLGVRRP